MDSAHNTGIKISRFSLALMVAFAVSLLVSIYLLFTLPGDLRFKGNLQYMDLVNPILVKLYIALASTGLLAVVNIYIEMKNIKVAIVYREKSAEQVAEEKIHSEGSQTESLNSQAVSASGSTELLTTSLSILSKRFSGVAGACYITKDENESKWVELVNGFALPLSESDVVRFNFGEGMVGQVAKSGTPIYIDDIPEGYFQAMSGLGQASPRFILILPMKKNNEVKGIIEVATFKAISTSEKAMAEKFTNEIGERLS